MRRETVDLALAMLVTVLVAVAAFRFLGWYAPVAIGAVGLIFNGIACWWGRITS